MNLKYTIVQTDIQDIEEILILKEKINLDLLNQGMTQWNNGYPNREVFENDILLNSQYKMLNEAGHIIGIGSVNNVQHQTFAEANWTDKSNNFFLIYRLGIDPDYQNQGLAGKMMDFLEDVAISKNATSIRLGALSSYEKVVSFYLKRNYKIIESKFFPVSKMKYHLMEKLIF